MGMTSMAEQMIFFAKPPILKCKPFEEWVAVAGGSIGSGAEVTFDVLDGGEWADVLTEASKFQMTAQPMVMKFQLLARALRTISGLPLVTDEQLAEHLRERAKIAGGDEEVGRLHRDDDEGITIPAATRNRYLVGMIRRWPLHVTNCLFEAYSNERDGFMVRLQGEVGKSLPASQVESGGKSRSAQDSPPSSESGMTVD